MNITQKINQIINDFIETKYSVKTENIKSLELVLNTDSNKQEFGDFNSNAALVLSKFLKRKPIDIAKEISDNIKSEYIEKIELAGPGFINIFLNSEAYQKLALEIFIKEKEFFKPELNKKTEYSIEFVSANPTGPLHIGHGRGGIIGDVLGNILKFIGNNVTKEFYINDAGSQIKKLGISLKIRCQQELGKDIPLPTDAYHGLYLKDIASKCVETYGPEVLEKSIEFFSTYAKDQLLHLLKNTLSDYGIKYDVWFSEKTLHDDNSIEKSIKKLEKKNYIYEKDGALWFKASKFGDDKDRVIRKNTGEYTYVAADIAYLENKINRGAEKLIMILGQDHHSYLKRLKAVMQAFGHNPDDLDIILYQLVTIKESGETLRLSKRAGRIVTLEDVVEAVGTDVARFFYLNKKADAHLDFNVDLALKQTEENPVYYAQYAYVRTNSIIQKAKEAHKEFCSINQKDYKYITKTEALLIKKIISLKNLLINMSKNYQIHLLTYYVLELAQNFHSYYSKNRVIDANNIDQSKGRLFVILLLNRTLKICFDVLGISAPEKM